ncbi:unnamed protein product [Chrysodeixis includens]|uniref:3-hydroxyisobutyrate dehydrogenase n=1 Tax=Chrysodeixis includens TaxID=689277 RepID=A0A9P0FT83_CHRIL|nr:unnamed protein product [Chrysodeixis includens]
MAARGKQCFLLASRHYSSKADKNVAFLGLGNMGGFMAANIAKKGFNVRGYDPSKEALDAAAKNGIKSAGSIAEAVEGADVVVSILPSNKVVLDAYLGDNGVVKNNGIKSAGSIAEAVEGADVVVSILPSNKVVLDAYLGDNGVVKNNGIKSAGSIAEAVEGADVVVSILPSNKVVLDAYLGDNGVVKNNGIKSAGSIAEAVEGADVVVSILPSNKVVLDAYLGDNGVVKNNGIKSAGSIAEAVEGADVVVSILPSNKVVLDAYLGDNGVVKNNGIKSAGSIAEAVEGADVVVSILPSNKVVLDAYLGDNGVVKNNGIKSAGSIAEAVEGADVVVSILPSNKVVLDAYHGDNGVVKNTAKGTLLIDSSTVDPNVPKEIFCVAQEAGKNFTDAPVSGGVMGAQNATLAFMAGGRKEDFDRSLPILQCMGIKHFHCGEIGSGQVAKLTNNMLMGITGMATAECMNMGIKMGLDPKVLLDVLNNSSARSWSTEVYCPVPGLVATAPSSRNYDNGFKNELMVKALSSFTWIVI